MAVVMELPRGGATVGLRDFIKAHVPMRAPEPAAGMQYGVFGADESLAGRGFYFPQEVDNTPYVALESLSRATDPAPLARAWTVALVRDDRTVEMRWPERYHTAVGIIVFCGCMEVYGRLYVQARGHKWQKYL